MRAVTERKLIFPSNQHKHNNDSHHYHCLFFIGCVKITIFNYSYYYNYLRQFTDLIKWSIVYSKDFIHNIVCGWLQPEVFKNRQWAKPSWCPKQNIKMIIAPKSNKIRWCSILIHVNRWNKFAFLWICIRLKPHWMCINC